MVAEDRIAGRIEGRKRKIGSKRTPRQSRSLQRRQEILRTTATLLDRVGFDDLTTILIAKELRISVGSLYHYFPNKQAILYALGEQWLEEQTRAAEHRHQVTDHDLVVVFIKVAQFGYRPHGLYQRQHALLLAVHL